MREVCRRQAAVETARRTPADARRRASERDRGAPAYEGRPRQDRTKARKPLPSASTRLIRCVWKDRTCTGYPGPSTHGRPGARRSQGSAAAAPGASPTGVCARPSARRSCSTGPGTMGAFTVGRAPRGRSYAGVAQLARAPAFQAGCRGFESHRPLSRGAARAGRRAAPLASSPPGYEAPARLARTRCDRTHVRAVQSTGTRLLEPIATGP